MSSANQQRLLASPLHQTLPESRAARQRERVAERRDGSFYPNPNASRPFSATQLSGAQSQQCDISSGSDASTAELRVGYELSTRYTINVPLYADVDNGSESPVSRPNGGANSSYARLQRQRSEKVLLSPMRRALSAFPSAPPANSPTRVHHHSAFISDPHSTSNTHHLRFLKRPATSQGHLSSINSTLKSPPQTRYKETTFAATQHQYDLFEAIAQYEKDERDRQNLEHRERMQRWERQRVSEDEKYVKARDYAAQKRHDREKRLMAAEDAVLSEIRQREGAELDERRDRLGLEANERSLRNAVRYDEWLSKTNISYSQRRVQLMTLECAIRAEACGHFLMDAEARYRNFTIRVSSITRSQILSCEKAERITQLKYLHKQWSHKARQEAEFVSLSSSERRGRAKIAEEEGSGFSLIDVEKIGVLTDLARQQRRAHEANLARMRSIEEENARVREMIVVDDIEQRGMIRQEETALRAIFREQHLVQRAASELAYRTRVELEAFAWAEECARQQAPVIGHEEKQRRVLMVSEQGDYNELIARHQELWQNVLRPIDTNVTRLAARFSSNGGPAWVQGSGSVGSMNGSGDRWAFPFHGVTIFRKTSSPLYPAGPCTDLRVEIRGVRGIHAGDEVEIPLHTPLDGGLVQSRGKDKPLNKDQQWSVNGQQIVDGNGNVVCYFGSERTIGIATRGGSDEDRLVNAMATNSLTLFWAEIACSNTLGFVDVLRVANRILAIIGFRCDPSCTNVDARELTLRVRANFIAALPSTSLSAGPRSSIMRPRRSASPVFRGSTSGYGGGNDEATSTADLHITSIVHLQTPKVYFATSPVDVLQIPTNLSLSNTGAVPRFIPNLPGLTTSSVVCSSTPIRPSSASPTRGTPSKESDQREDSSSNQVFYLLQQSLDEGSVGVPFDTGAPLPGILSLSTIPRLIPLQGCAMRSLNDQYVAFSATYVEAATRGKSRVMPFATAMIESGNDFSVFSLQVKLSYIAGADDNITFVGTLGGPNPLGSSGPNTDRDTSGIGVLTSKEEGSFQEDSGSDTSKSPFGVITETYALRRNEIVAAAVLQRVDKEGSFVELISSKAFEVQGRLNPTFPVSSKEVTICGVNTPRMVVAGILKRIGVIVDGKFNRSRSMEALLTFSEGYDGPRTSSPSRNPSRLPSAPLGASHLLTTESTTLFAEIIPTTLGLQRATPTGVVLHPTTFSINVPPETLAPRVYVDNRLGLPSWYSQRAVVNKLQLLKGCVALGNPKTRPASPGKLIEESPVGHAQSPRSPVGVDMVPPCTLLVSVEQGACSEDRLFIDFGQLIALRDAQEGFDSLSTPTTPRGTSAQDPRDRGIQDYSAPRPSQWRLVVDGPVIRYTPRAASSGGEIPPGDSPHPIPLSVVGSVVYSQVKQCRLQPEVLITLKSLPAEVITVLLQSLFFSTRVTLTSANALKVVRVSITPQTSRRSAPGSPVKGSFLPYSIPLTVIAGPQRLRVLDSTAFNQASTAASIPSETIPIGELPLRHEVTFSRAAGLVMAMNAVAGNHRRKVSDALGAVAAVPVIRLAKVSSSGADAASECDHLEPLRLDERIVLPTSTQIRKITVSIIEGLPSLASKILGEGVVSSVRPIDDGDGGATGVCTDSVASRLVFESPQWVQRGDEMAMLSAPGSDDFCAVSPSFGFQGERLSVRLSERPSMGPAMASGVLNSIAYRHNFALDVSLLKTLLIQVHTKEDIVEEGLVQVDVQPIFLPSYFIGMLDRAPVDESPRRDRRDSEGDADVQSPRLPSGTVDGVGGQVRDEVSPPVVLGHSQTTELRIPYIGTSLLNDGANGGMRLFPNGQVADEDTVSCGDGYFIFEALEGMRPGDRLVLVDSAETKIEYPRSAGFGRVSTISSGLAASPTFVESVNTQSNSVVGPISGGKTRIRDAVTNELLAETEWSPQSFGPTRSVSRSSVLHPESLAEGLGEEPEESSCIVLSIVNKTLLSDCSKLLRLFGFAREDPHGYVDPHVVQCLLRFNARDEIVSDTRFSFSVEVASPPLYSLPVERTVRTGLHGSRLRPLTHLKLAMPSHKSIGTALTISADQPFCGVFLQCPTVRGVGPQSAPNTPSGRRRSSPGSPSTLNLQPTKTHDLAVDSLTGCLVCNFGLAKRLAGVNSMRPTPGVDGIVLGRIIQTETLPPAHRTSSGGSRPSSALPAGRTRPTSAVSVQSAGSACTSSPELRGTNQSLHIALEPTVPCALLRVILNHVGVDTSRCKSNPTVLLEWNLFAQQSRARSKVAASLSSPETDTFVSRVVCDVEGEAAGVAVTQPTDRFVAFDGRPVNIFEGLHLVSVDESDDEVPLEDETPTKSTQGRGRPSVLQLRSSELLSVYNPSSATFAEEDDEHGVVAIEVMVVGARTADALEFPDPVLVSFDDEARYATARNTTPPADMRQSVRMRSSFMGGSVRRADARKPLQQKKEAAGVSKSPAERELFAASVRGGRLWDDADGVAPEVSGLESPYHFEMRTRTHVRVSFDAPQSLSYVNFLIQGITFTGICRLSGPVRLLQLRVFFANGRCVTRQAQVSLRSKALMVPLRSRQLSSNAGEPTSILSGLFASDQKILSSATFHFTLMSTPLVKGRCFDRLGFYLSDGLISNSKLGTIHLRMASDEPPSAGGSQQAGVLEQRLGPVLATVTGTTERDMCVVLSGASALTVATITSLLESVVIFYADDRSPGLGYDVVGALEGGGKSGKDGPPGTARPATILNAAPSVNAGSSWDAPASPKRARGVSSGKVFSPSTSGLGSEALVRVCWECEVDRNSAFSSGRVISDEIVISVAAPAKAL